MTGEKMTKQTHESGGFLIGVITIYPMILKNLNNYLLIYQLLLIILYFRAVNIGSLFPDIDLKSSYISKRYPLISKSLGKKFKHRGFTHSLLCLIVLYIVYIFFIYISNWNVVIEILCYGFWFGYASHIFLDLFTHQGVELLFPLKININFLNLKTNSIGEKIFNKILKILYLLPLSYYIYKIYIYFLL